MATILATGSTIRLIGLTAMSCSNPRAAPCSVDLQAASGADGLVPDRRALRIDLVAGVLPQRQRAGGGRRRDLGRVVGGGRHQRHVELLAAHARATGVAALRVVSALDGVVPHLLLENLEGGLDLGLLCRAELVPVGEVDEVALHGA